MGMPPKIFFTELWNNTAISIQQIEAIEDDILALIIRTYDIDVSEDYLRCHEFFTYS